MIAYTVSSMNDSSYKRTACYQSVCRWKKNFTHTICSPSHIFEEKTNSPLDNQYDYKDSKTFNNEDFQQFLKGYYAEIKDSANDDKTVDQIKDIVLKNLAKDPMFYTKDGVFGVKGIGYKSEEIKAPTGKFKGSGYGDINK